MGTNLITQNPVGVQRLGAVTSGDLAFSLGELSFETCRSLALVRRRDAYSSFAA
jgi:hypothetical protein